MTLGAKGLIALGTTALPAGSALKRLLRFAAGAVLILHAGGAKAQLPTTLTFGKLPFDFANDFYRANGIEPANLLMRVNGVNGTSVVEALAPDSNHTNIRINAVNCGYDAAGGFICYPDPPATFKADAFMSTPEGQHARVLANQFHAFIFPRRNGNPLSPMPPNRRQDNLFETTMGYQTNNPPALWRLVFPRYTDAALNTPAGQAALAELRDRNGTDADGTPIIKRLSEINELAAAGFLELRQRPEDGSAGFPWVV